jgi:HAD superfamily hydrolase (TIGR01509 family)
MSAQSISLDQVRGNLGHTKQGCLSGRNAPADAPSAERPRGLLFGMADVLHDATLWRRWLLQLIARFGLQPQYQAFFEAWDRDYFMAVRRGQREFGEAFQAFLASAGLSPGQIDEVDAASQARRRILETNARPLPGVRSTLGQLRQTGMTLAVLADSEFSADRLSQQLGRMGLGDFFTAVISSFDLERTKPDPVCYQQALAAMSLSAAEVWFVGQGVEELQGARTLSMSTVAFNFGADAEADHYLDRFDELLHLVQGTGRRSWAHEQAA